MQAEQVNIIYALYPAAGDNRQAAIAGKINRRLYIASGQHAVAAHIGE